MGKPNARVLLHERDTIVFPFNAPPYVPVHYGEQRCSLEVDPFPGYAHDEFKVADHLKHVAKCFPLPFDVTVNLLSYESTARINGRASMDHKKQSGVIVLDGKRTPIHPAMSRYLVAHEYGHLVQAHIEIANGMERGAYEAIYAEMRGLKMPDSDYGGGSWHLSPGEIMANDFRIVMCRSEVAFWPHPDTTRPEEHMQVDALWKTLKDKYAFTPFKEGTELALAS